jgi:hypothetical protein
MITTADVVRAIEVYFQGGALSYLDHPGQWADALARHASRQPA